MVDIQSATAEIRQGKKRKKRNRTKNITTASATQDGHNNYHQVLEKKCSITTFTFFYLKKILHWILAPCTTKIIPVVSESCLAAV